MIHTSSSRHKAFTIIELLIAIGIISTALVTAMLMMRQSVTFVEKSKHEVVAIGLAKEGMEIVSSIRHTNRTRRSSKKNTCRLMMDPQPYLTGSDAIAKCTTNTPSDLWMTGGIYSIQRIANQGNIYHRLVPSTGETIVLSGGIYTRKIIGGGLYTKDTLTAGGDLIACPYGTASYPGGSCNSNAPKEYRYCVQISYNMTASGSVRLCSVLTNYQE